MFPKLFAVFSYLAVGKPKNGHTWVRHYFQVITYSTFF
jgi:hypothetical protein